MEKKEIPWHSLVMHKMSNNVMRFTGSPLAFIVALLLVFIWAITGPLFKFSENWQLTINTGTSIITFLMVFIIQQSQNKDILALHLKLNELIAASEVASNRLVSAEDLTKEELANLKTFYAKISAVDRPDEDIHSSHSIEEHIVRPFDELPVDSDADREV